MRGLDLLAKAKRVVVKVGTGNLTEGNRLSERKVAGIVNRIVSLKKEGKEVILVSSGAIGAGMTRLGLRERPRDVKQLQAAAAVGQGELMKIYSSLFGRHEIVVAQVLLTGEDFSGRVRYLNLRNTINTLLKLDVVPVINENDTVAVDEIKFGDNDNLSALVAVNLEADALLIVSSSGLRTGDPKRDKKACLVPVVEKITREIEAYGGGSTALGSGGMRTKLQAAKKATKAGIPVIVTSLGVDGFVSEDSTLFLAGEGISDREHWLLYTSKPRGVLVVDDGASKALVERNVSLLASGVVKVEGSFGKGDTVSITDKRGVEIARGVSNFSSVDAMKIAGKKSSDISKTLGRKIAGDIVSRCDMVLV